MTLINKFKYLLRWKFTNILVIVFVFFILTHWNTSNSTNPSIRTFDFHSYPDSRSFIEYQRLQIDQVFSLNGEYHSGSYPIIWLDESGDVHWNQPAQNEMLNYLLEKQFPQDDISTCLTRQLFIVDQWPMGFFSRYHCFIEQFGQTLYSPSMVLLSPRRFAVSHSSNEDFRNEGILRYYQSFSLCSSYINHPQLKTLHDQLPSINSGSANTKNVRSMTDLLADDEKNFRFKYSREIWIFGYDHVPHRRWLFDKNREELKTKLTYTSPIEMLIDHSNEHIYYPTNSKLNLTTWNPRNSPQGPPKHVLPGTSVSQTITDRIFSSFIRYMFILFFSQLAPRIQVTSKLLAQHWSEYLADKYNRPYDEALKDLGVIFIRRGDKMPEDSFWQKHKRWRNISMYVKGLVDQEKVQQKKYSSVFVVTDDASVMSSIQEYAREGLTSSKKDESYAREHLHKREILYNVFAPQSCFDPFIRIGFDQFLVNVKFVTDYASFVVGHVDSNVGRYLEEIIYVNRQLKGNIGAQTYVVNAPDTLD